MSSFTLKRFVSFCFVILFIIILDHSLKYWVATNMNYRDEKEIVNGILSLWYLQNSGLLLSMDLHVKYLRIVVLVFKFMLIILTTCYVFKEEKNKMIIKRKILAGAFIVGGGFSNFLDWMFNGFIYSDVLYRDAPFKLGYGNVIDMLYLPFTCFQIPLSWPLIGGIRTSFPIFNIADIFVTLGVIIALTIIWSEEKYVNNNKHLSNRNRGKRIVTKAQHHSSIKTRKKKSRVKKDTRK